MINVLPSEHSERKEQQVPVQTPEAKVASLEHLLVFAAFVQDTVKRRYEVVTHNTGNQRVEKSENKSKKYNNEILNIKAKMPIVKASICIQDLLAFTGGA